MQRVATKKEGLRELLYIYLLEVEHEESWLGRMLKFQKLDYFVRFEQRHSVEGLLRFRIDDLIFLAVLLALNVFFSTYNSLLLAGAPAVLQPLITGFQLYNVMMFVGSALWILLPHWYTKLGLLGLYVLVPALIVMVFMNVMPFDPVDPTTTMFSYFGYLTLPILLLECLLVYPLKEYIRTTIGSLYSMLYAFAVLVLLFLWPVHSVLVEFVQNLGTIRLQFISDNIVILYCLWSIILCFVFLYVHNTLLSPAHDKVKAALVPRYLTQDELLDLKPTEQPGALLRSYKALCRCVSFLIFLIFVGSEVYFLSLMIGYVQQQQYYNMMLIGAVALYSPAFLIIGSVVTTSNLSNKWLFVILSLIAVGPSCAYPFIAGSAYDELSMLVLCVGPFTMVFWMALRTIRRYEKVLFLGVLSFLYIFFYIPVVLLTLNELKLFTPDSASQDIIRYVGLGVMGFATAAVIMYLIVIGGLAAYKFISENQNKVGKDQTIDYDYDEEGECVYVPYTLNKSFSLTGLTSANLKRSGYFLNSILFIGCCMGSLYAIQKVSMHPEAYFFSPTAKYVILTQFPMALSFYLLLHAHIAIKPFVQVPSYFIGLLVALLVGSLGLTGASFIPLLTQGFQVILRLTAVTLFVVLLLAMGLTYLKTSNESIHKFISPISALLIWFLIILPFVECAPIASVLIDQQYFGDFMYYMISGASVLVILVVSIITLIFNALMNRFEEEKKMKYITNELKQYFNGEGVESDDVILHRMYESYEQRDKKYMYYLRNGYPINLYTEKGGEARLASMEEYKQLKDAEKNNKGLTVRKSKLRESKTNSKAHETTAGHEDGKNRHCCLSFLDCLCGDDEPFQDKVRAVLDAKQATSAELEDLLPLVVYESIVQPSYELKKLKPQNISNQNKKSTISTRSVALNNLTKSTRKYVSDLADQLKHSSSLRVEAWHQIFEFFSNEDYPPRKLIYSDLESFVRSSEIDDNMNLPDRLYEQYAKEQWGEMWALNLEGFSLLVGDICDERIESTLYQSKMDGILLEVVFPNLCRFREFRQHLDQIFKVHRFERMGKQEIEDSPFLHYDRLKAQLSEKNRNRNQRYSRREKAEKEKKIMERASEAQQTSRQQSCRQRSKRNLIACCGAFGGCVETTFMYIPRKLKQLFSKKPEESLVRRKVVKPWELLSTESVKLMETVERQYSKKEETQYHFRHTFNNYLPALMKLLDLYYFVSLSLGDSQIDWSGNAASNISPNNGGLLYENYQIIMWVSTGLVVVYLGMSIKAVRYISEGRFGLTESGLPAGFPTPMFFFTTIYKLLSLSLFSFIMQTIYDTFDCTWFNSPPFLLFRDSSLECLSAKHDVFLVVAIVSMAIYYPISAYVSPNFQFAEKSLDLKYKPSYLVLFFQCKLILVAAQVLLTSTPQNSTLELIYIAIILAVLIVLAFTVLQTQPCLIKWFNFLDALILLIGLVVNACGLAIYLTGQRIICIVVASVVSALLVGGTAWLLKARFFSNSAVDTDIANNEELLMALDYTHKKHRKLNKNTQPVQGVNSSSKLVEPEMLAVQL